MVGNLGMRGGGEDTGKDTNAILERREDCRAMLLRACLVRDSRERFITLAPGMLIVT